MCAVSVNEFDSVHILSLIVRVRIFVSVYVFVSARNS